MFPSGNNARHSGATRARMEREAVDPIRTRAGIVATAATCAITLSAFLSAGCGGQPFDGSSVYRLAEELGLSGVIPVVAGEVATSPAAASAAGDLATQIVEDPDAGAPTVAESEGVTSGGHDLDPAAGTTNSVTEAPTQGSEARTADDGTTSGKGSTGNGNDPDELPTAPSASDPPPFSGVYALNLEGCSQNVLAPYLDNPNLDGFSLRAAWSDIEPVDGTYDWSPFDAVVDHAASHGKKVMLRILAGTRTPEWVYEAGAARFDFVDDNPYHSTYGEIISMPVPWDPIFLTYWFEVVTAMGARYADHAAVVLVAITGPATAGEMHLGDKDNSEAWHAVGYSNEVLIETWKLTIDAFVTAFPEQYGLVAVANPVSFDNPAQVREAVAAYCAQKGCGIQGNWLAANTAPDGTLYQQVADFAAVNPVGFQMLCSATQERFGGELSTAIDLALDAGASFLELYKPDITAFAEDVAFAHEQLVHGQIAQ
jgi:hypothetical protein